MLSKAVYLLLQLKFWMMLHCPGNNGVEIGGDTGSTMNTEDYCMQLETFQPRCLTNEAIAMNSAIYGRMRIGRCLTAEEMDTFGAVYKNDPRYFGCSVNVVSILDRKCSGKTECDVRHLEISDALETKPCYPGLNMYLEVSYDCITIAAENRSCTVTVSNIPSHIVASESPGKCATEMQPWLVEAPAGQKIRVTLIDFTATLLSQHEDGRKTSCLGVIEDQVAKRNVSICIGSEQRTRYLYSSSAESLKIYYNAKERKQKASDAKMFALKLEAIGCTDLIPPEDSWLKRSDDSIVIGCYSNRQTWQLHCEGERWIGVFGNCSQGHQYLALEETKVIESTWNNDHVLTIVAACGFIVTICLAVVCTGIVCLRRLSTKSKRSMDYKTLDFQFNSSMNNRGNDTMQPCLLPSAALINGVHSSCVSHQQMAPTYSVFVGDGEFNDDPAINTDSNSHALNRT